jgi:hypothetical protein
MSYPASNQPQPRPIPGPRSGRMGSRLRRRLAVAALVGPATGIVIGAVIGLVAFDRWGSGSWMALVASVIACTMLALLWAGYSSLESPDPGREPSDTSHPIADRDELVREESGDPIPPSDHDHSSPDRTAG